MYKICRYITLLSGFFFGIGLGLGAIEKYELSAICLLLGFGCYIISLIIVADVEW